MNMHLYAVSKQGLKITSGACCSQDVHAVVVDENYFGRTLLEAKRRCSCTGGYSSCESVTMIDFAGLVQFAQSTSCFHS